MNPSQGGDMSVQVRTEIAFMDGSSLVVEHPRQVDGDAAGVLAHVQRSLEADKIVIEVQGSLYAIPLRNVKYVEVFPAPQVLPPGVICGTRIVKKDSTS
jgi:hypothetical protein